MLEPCDMYISTEIMLEPFHDVKYRAAKSCLYFAPIRRSCLYFKKCYPKYRSGHDALLPKFQTQCDWINVFILHRTLYSSKGGSYLGFNSFFFLIYRYFLQHKIKIVLWRRPADGPHVNAVSRLWNTFLSLTALRAWGHRSHPACGRLDTYFYRKKETNPKSGQHG